MLSDLRQNELDLAEEKLLLALFGSTSPSAKAQWLLNFLGIDLNKYLREFEYLVRPMMNEEGLVDGKLARALVGEKWPSLAGLIPERLFRLSEIADPMVKLLEGLKGKLQ